MKRGLIIIVAAVMFGVYAASAADCTVADADCYNRGASLSAPSFRILDSQHSGFGLFGAHISSSSNFTLLGTVGDLAIGLSSISTDGTKNQLESGFLYFPLIVAPVPSATPGPSTGQVAVSWTPLRAGLQTQGGLTNSTYKVCWSATAVRGTSPTCGVSVSAPATSQTVTPASPGTYYFWVQAYDAHGALIAESEFIQQTTKAAPPPAGGGGGGGALLPPSTTLTGLAFPFATVHIMLNGVEIATTPTDANAVFNVNTSIVRPGTTNYGFWGVDRLGRRSVTWAFSVPISGSGRVQGLIVPPTIVVNPTQMNPGTSITVRGESVPAATVEVTLMPSARTVSAVVAADGSYSVSLSTAGLSTGVYDVKTRTLLLPARDQSTWSQSIQIGIGVPPPPACNHPPDVNRDTKINLVDFSIMAYWWRRDVGIDNANDLNCDTRVDLQDFSILAYYWTGR